MTFHAGQILADVFVPALPEPVWQAAAPMPPVRTQGHTVHNLTVEGTHTYIAGGIRVHNTSILSFLNPQQLQLIVPGSLDDTNNDGRLDYVELDNNLGGLNAQGATIYKMETVNGVTVAKAYVTHADAYGRLVQTQYLMGPNGEIIDGSVTQIVLRGADFGYQLGAIVTPYLTAAILDDDASPFERFAVGTIAGTFIQNLFEFAGGAIHDQIASGGLQNGTLDDIAAITFADFGDELIGNAVDNAAELLTQWIMAEVFEGLNTDTFGGKFAYLLAQQGVDWIVDVSIHTIAHDVLQLTDDQIARWGLTAPQFNQVFSGPNLLNLLFKAAIGTILPALESTEAQIGSAIITLALDIFAGIGGIIGSVIGYIGGLILDLIFDKDPQAFATVAFDPTSGEMRVSGVTSADGGNEAVAQAMARGFNDFLNGILDTAEAGNHNLATVMATGSWSFGHREANYRNGDGANYASAELALAKRLVDAIRALDILDGDLKIGKVVDDVSALSGLSYQQVLQELQLRIQIASDYQHYLENQSTIDALLAADPMSAFGIGWTQTFLKAAEYGLMNAFTRVGSAADNVIRTSVGNDSIDGGAGNDTVEVFGGNDRASGGAGNDLIYGGAGNDTVWGNDGDDTIFGGGGNDSLYGGAGIDTFYIGEESGRRTIDGGTDYDIVSFAGNRAGYVHTRTSTTTVEVRNTATNGVIVLTNVEFVRYRDTVVALDPTYNSIVGTIGNDVLTGTDMRDAINGLAGDDILFGEGGDDFLSGDLGDDTLFGGAGNDWLFGVRGRDVIYGGAGNDNIFGGTQDDLLWGDGDADTINGESGDDVINGGGGADLLYGGNFDDVIEGDTGNDQLFGGESDDDLFGGAGNDTLHGENSDDVMYGGDGVDTLSGGHGDDVVFGGVGGGQLYGGGLPGQSGTGDDVLYGGATGESLFGGWGDDIAYGGAGNDRIFALPSAAIATPFSPLTQPATEQSAANYYSDFGFDVAYGGDGDDIIGITGADVAFGGAGNDAFYIQDLQARIDGGTGTDLVRFVGTNFIDAQWFRAADGRIAAILWHNNSNGTHEGPNHFLHVVNVERIMSKEYTDKVLTFGMGFIAGGFGSFKYGTVRAVGHTEMTNAAFDAQFGAAAMLNRQWVAYNANPSDWNDIAPLTAAQTLTAGNDSVLGSVYDLAGRQWINGGDGNDTIETLSGADSVDGQNGNDSLDGGSGNDLLSGGDGLDRITGGSGADSIYGGTGGDTLTGWSGDDRIEGSWGEDRIEGQAGHDLLYGQQHNDLIYGGNGRDTIYGGEGQDTIYGDASHDSIWGDSGNDLIYGGDGGDRLNGGDGHDSIHGREAADVILGGEGDDRLDGDEDDDSLNGEGGNDSLWGDAGDDEIVGHIGNDYIDGGTGNDRLFGGDGNDTLHGNTGTDFIQGGAGDDVLLGSSHGDLMDGGAGTDTADYTASTSAVRVLLARGEGFGGLADLDRLVGIENLTGSALHDTLIGNAGTNVILGGVGNDSLDGEAGNDTLDGGDGIDRIDGGTGDDTLRGAAGVDTLSGGDGNDRLEGGDGDDTLNGGSGTDSILGGIGADRIDGGIHNDTLAGDAGMDSLTGGAGNDRLFGGDDDDALDGGEGNDSVVGGLGEDGLYGNVGNDTLAGEAGADLLDGGQGNDTLQGGDGDDILTGGLGNDTLTGGAGTDVFVIAANDGQDIITDWQDGTDRIGLGVGMHRAVVFADTGGARIQFAGEGSILLTGIAPAVITTADFVSGVGTGLTFGPTILGTALGETLNGTNGSDMIVGLDGNDRLNAGAGGDFLFGGLGSDHLHGTTVTATLFGGDGSDHLFSYAAADHLMGGTGADYARYEHSTAGVDIDLTRNIQRGGVAEGDSLISVEGAFGSNLADRMSGTDLGDRFEGNGGDDMLRGRDGHDTLAGGSGNDVLYGDGGNDSLTGGAGDDILTGGAGADRFIFTNGAQGIDRIDGFNGIGGDPADGDLLVFQSLRVGTFVWRGASAFSGGSDNSEARFASGNVLVDTNGDGAVDITIRIDGMTTASQLTTNSFLWS